MNAALMLNPHQDTAQVGATPWAWTLAPKEAHTLPAEPLARWLRVECGSVWLTQANGIEPACDIWLAAGQSLALPAGSAWVVEAWPQARLSLLLQSPLAAAVSPPRGAWRLAVSWLALRLSSLLPVLQRRLAF